MKLITIINIINILPFALGHKITEKLYLYFWTYFFTKKGQFYITDNILTVPKSNKP